MENAIYEEDRVLLSDLYIVGVLLVVGEEYTDCTKQDNKVYFTFKLTEDVDNVIKQYYSGKKINVNLLSLKNKIKELKEIIHMKLK